MVNSSSLFHFTRDFETLKQILAEGLRFSYCYEPFGEIVAKQGWDIVLKVGATTINCKGIAIPMICFCDIPAVTIAFKAVSISIGASSSRWMFSTSWLFNVLSHKASVLR